MKGSRGVAQLMVLWALVLLGTLAAAFSLSMRTEAQAARNGVDDARAYFQARAGVSRALMLLATLPSDNVARSDIQGRDGDASYRVRVASESGKVDINFVSEDDLLEILRNGGLPEDEAAALRDAVFDWKDADDTPRDRGAEFPEYARLREPLSPRNGNLRSVGELRYVKGVTRELYGRFLSRVFTAHGGSSQVNALHVSPFTLKFLPGVTPEAAAEILSRREEGIPVSPVELGAIAGRGLLSAKGLSMLSGRNASRIYEVTSTGRAGNGVVHTVRCLAEVRGSGRNNVRILTWVDLADREVDG